MLAIVGLVLAARPMPPVLAQAIAGGSRVVDYQARTTAAGPVLEQQVLKPDGSSVLVGTAIAQDFALEANAQSGTRNLYLLRKTRGDTVMLWLTDSLGRTLHQRRQHLPRMSGSTKLLAPPHLFGLPGGQGFVFTYPSGKSGRPALEITALSPALSVVWQQQFAPPYLSAVQHIAASDTYLWLVLKEYLALSLRPRVLSFRLATGEVACNQSLAPNDALDGAAVVPAGLLLLGTSDRRGAYTTPADQLESSEYRRDFALLLRPTGQRDFGVSLGWPPSGRPPHYRWQSAGPLPNGGYQLVGETYRTPLKASTIALGILGAGLIGAGGFGVIPMSGYTTERPLGLVLAQLSTTGQVSAVRELAASDLAQAPAPVPPGPNPSQSFPVCFRFQGFSPDYKQLVLSTDRQVLAYTIATQQLRPLTPAHHSTPTIFAIEANRVTIRWSLHSNATGAEFEQIALP